MFWEDIRPGMCTRDPPSTDPDVVVVDCGSAHYDEVIAKESLPGPAKWPGDAQIVKAATKKCEPSFERYVGVKYEDSRLSIDPWTADVSGWQDGDHTVVCLVYEETTPRTGSLRGSRR
ncbi:septum formation family protein [Terrabacter ginsenosidimutans]